MRTAIQQSLVGADSDASHVSGYCPTNNCTWQPYTSLAFCASTVEDISATIDKTCGLSAADEGLIMCNVTTGALKAQSIVGIEFPGTDLGVFSLSPYNL